MSKPSAEAALSIDRLSIDFVTDHGWTNVVKDVSFDVGSGEIVGLVGESGSGKSVTSLAALGLLPSAYSRIASGSISFSGTDLASLSDKQLRSIRGNDISMIFQEPMTSLNPSFTVGDQIAEAYRQHNGGRRRAALARAADMLDLVGIPDARHRLGDYPHEFSGGMRQRAMIAMALVCEPDLLIADEPTTALDVTVQAQIIELLGRIRDETGCGILFITHDLGVVSEICDRVIVMYAGEVVESAVCRDIFIQPKHPYTEGLLSAMPQLGAREETLASIPGRPPEPWNLPGGCRFNPRCAYARPGCANEVIALDEVVGGRASRCVRVDELTLAGAQ